MSAGPTSSTDAASWSVVSDRFGNDVILRAFDTARRAVSVARTGQVGMFPGYDRLELAATGGEEGAIVITARVIAEDSSQHTVEYEARALQSGAAPDGRLLARGVGRTLLFGLVTAGPSTPTTTRQEIA